MTTVTSPIDLLNAIPFLIGYQPDDAIILMALKEDSITMAIRIDFPKKLLQDEVHALVAKLEESGAEGALMVSYIPDDCSDAEGILAPIVDQLVNHQIPLQESIVVVSGRWRSLICSDSECCPIEGSPMPELVDSRIASEEIASGKPFPFADLASMSRSLAPLPEDSELLALIDEIPEIDYGKNPNIDQRAGATAVTDFIHEFAAAGISKNKELIALLLVRLQDLQVRDFALGSMRSEDSDLFFASWRWLMRRAPQGYVAPPAVLFAVACYERGDGALANLALQRAREDQPNYSMVELLSRVFRSGQPPTLFSELRAELHPRVCEALFSGTMKE